MRRQKQARLKPPTLAQILSKTVANESRPVCFVLAGHNGSGKSTLWNEKLSNQLRIPLVNADRLTTSILPERNPSTGKLPDWAQEFRDKDDRWQRLSQEGVRTFVSLIMAQTVSFAMETVFSHWEPRPDGSHFSSKIQEITNLQAAGYFVVLMFVGLTSPALSALRVQTRLANGGHDVPLEKIYERFPRTQAAIKAASGLADLTIMFDNSRSSARAFSLTRVQSKGRIVFDCRDSRFQASSELRNVANEWLPNVAGRFLGNRAGARKSPSQNRRRARKHA